MDSFDHYTATADILGKWTTVAGTSPTIVAAAGRRSTASLRFPSALASTASKTIDSQQTWIIGFAINTSVIPSTARTLVSVYDSGTLHMSLVLNTDGTISTVRNVTTIDTTAAVLTAAGYSHLEWKIKIDDTVGTSEIRLNGVAISNISGQDTRNGANATANQIRLGSASTHTGTVDIDDFYILDSSGSAPVNTFLGDSRVDCFLPSGNGNSSQLLGSDADSTNNYLLVDEPAENGNTDYVGSATAAQKDTYAIADMSHNPSLIYGVQNNMWAEKDDAGTRTVCGVTRSNGADYDGTTQALSTTYADLMAIVTNNPDTSTAWTQTTFNAAEFGIKVVA